MSVDRLISSVQVATNDLRWVQTQALACLSVCPKDNDYADRCQWLQEDAENAALALDMALAQASDARRAEDDEIRRSVAW